MDFSNNTNTGGVRFEEEARPAVPTTPVSESKVATYLIKYSGGIIRNEKQAFFIVLVVTLVLIIMAIITIKNNSHEPTSGEVPENQIVPS